MAPIAAVMTGPNAGAIATIQLFGDSAATVLRDIFRRTDDKPLAFTPGRVFLGEIIEGLQMIDQVTVGCEDHDVFAIHCHGNPMIVERVMGLLGRHGVQAMRPEQLLARMLMKSETENTIAVEARLALTTVKTIEGATLITHQVTRGLTEKARQWQAGLDSTSLEQIAMEARQILKDSDTARLIISGCTIALIGPPNTGKSTLLNVLAGREKAIVTDIRGTTRDWVSAEIRIPPLAVTLIDTAGLDPLLTAAGDIDQTAQHKSIEALNRADLILLVLDASQPADQFSTAVAAPLLGRRSVTVLNKADLVLQLDPGLLPEYLGHVVRISAKQETGLEDLIRAIHEICGVACFRPNACVAFTDRQERLLQRLCHTTCRTQVRSIVTQLLEGTVNNFAAHFDMLGFGNAVQNNFHEA